MPRRSWASACTPMPGWPRHGQLGRRWRCTPMQPSQMTLRRQPRLALETWQAPRPPAAACAACQELGGSLLAAKDASDGQQRPDQGCPFCAQRFGQGLIWQEQFGPSASLSASPATAPAQISGAAVGRQHSCLSVRTDHAYLSCIQSSAHASAFCAGFSPDRLCLHSSEHTIDCKICVDILCKDNAFRGTLCMRWHLRG